MRDFAAVQPNDAPWLKAGFRNLGLAEVAGPLSNPTIIEMYRAAGAKVPEKLDDSSWSWCSAAMCYWFEKAKLAGTRSLLGRSWLNRKNSTRLDVSKPLPRGAVVVLKYDNDPNHGHVATLLADNGVTIQVLGANQRNHVCVMSWKRTALIGAIWPNEWPLEQPHADVPLPRPRPELEEDPEPPEEPARQPDDPGVDRDERQAPAKAPWYRRLWLRWFGGGVGSYLGLAGLTDWQIAAVLIGGGILTAILAVVAVLAFIGADGRAVVRGWIVRQFRS